MSNENIELVHELYDAFARRDLPARLATLADDIEWHETASGYAGEVRRGHDAIIQQGFGPSVSLPPGSPWARPLPARSLLARAILPPRITA